MDVVGVMEGYACCGKNGGIWMLWEEWRDMDVVGRMEGYGCCGKHGGDMDVVGRMEGIMVLWG